MLMVVLTPVIFIVNKLSMAVLFLLRVDPNKKQDPITEDELRTIVEVSHEEGVIESEEKKMINNVFDFGDAVAKDVMVPRIDMVMVDVNATFDELMELFQNERFTRIPVYEENTDNVIGIVNMKDFILFDHEKEKNFSIRDYLRQPLYTYEYKKTAELMLEMRKTFNNIVIVLDEYGATAGLITLEDMLEEIVGEIRDEYDQDEEDEVREDAVRMNIWSMVLPSWTILNDRLGLELESEDYDSIGGLVIGLLDHLPEEGEEVDYENLHLKVEEMDKNRIGKIRHSDPSSGRNRGWRTGKRQRSTNKTAKKKRMQQTGPGTYRVQLCCILCLFHQLKIPPTMPPAAQQARTGSIRESSGI